MKKSTSCFLLNDCRPVTGKCGPFVNVTKLKFFFFIFMRTNAFHVAEKRSVLRGECRKCERQAYPDL